MNDEQIPIAFEEKKPSHGKRVYVTFGLIVIALVAIGTIKMQWQNHVYVSQILVEGVSVVSKEDVVRLMHLPPRTSMYDIDLTVLQRNIQANTFIKRAIIKRDGLSTLRVIVEERTPAAMLSAKELFYIDPEGIVLPYIASSETYDIPVISGVDSAARITVGKQIMNEDIRDALDIIAAAKYTGDNIYHTISEIKLRTGHDMILYSFESGIPIIFGKGDAAKKIVKLDAFWQKFIQNNSTQDIHYIDVRYDDQVIVSRKTSS